MNWFNVLALSLVLFVGSFAYADGQVGRVMSIPEMDFLVSFDDPNYVAPAKPVLISHDAIESIAGVYKKNGDQKYARRLGVVLYLFSQDFKAVPEKAAIVFEPVDMVETGLVDAYLAVRDSAGVAELSKEVKVDVPKAIENGLIRGMVDRAISKHGRRFSSGDMIELFPMYLADICLAGRVIGEPEYIRFTINYLNDPVNFSKRVDGEGLTFDMHSTGGQDAHIALCRRVRMVFNSVEGYSDLASYVDGDGKRYDKVSLKDLPYIDKLLNAASCYAFPDGQRNLIGDTKALKICGPLGQSRDLLVSGIGHAVLGDGRGRNQSQVQMCFSGNRFTPYHHDCLSVAWFGHGRLMSGEIGGQLSYNANWARSALSHNTVVVDRQEQGDNAFGNVLFFDSSIKGLAAIQVEGMKAYKRSGVNVYRRSVIYNTIDVKRPYFVDVFEVEGGTVHDYSIHGSVSGDMEGRCSLSMKSVEGNAPLFHDDKSWIDPNTPGLPSVNYVHLGNVRNAKAVEDFNVTFSYKDDKDSGTRVHMLGDGSSEVFLAEGPAVAKGGKTPHLIVRRCGEAGLKSVFVAVYDIFGGQTNIRSVKRLTHTDEYISLKIDLGDRVDMLFYSPSGKKSMIGGQVQMKGRVGLVCEDGGHRRAYLLDGTVLRKGSTMVRLKKSAYYGAILKSIRTAGGDGVNGFVVDTILPVGEELSGKWMIVAHMNKQAEDGGEVKYVTHAYQIDHIERRGPEMIVHVKGDHGLEIREGVTKETFANWRSFGGKNWFAIYNHAKTVK